MLQTSLFSSESTKESAPAKAYNGDPDGLRDYQRERVDETLSLLTQHRSVTFVLHPGAG